MQCRPHPQETQEMAELDRTDRKILDILQRQGRISMTELAEQVGLSTSPVTERVKRMEREGVIMGYYARIYARGPGQDPAGVRRDHAVVQGRRGVRQGSATSCCTCPTCWSAISCRAASTT